MIQVITTFLIASVLVLSGNAQKVSKATTAKFVAYDQFSGWGNPREPKQMLIIEIQKSSFLPEGKLVKVIYYPKTTGMRGGAKFLEADILNYRNLWKMKLRQPLEEQKPDCEIGNFLMTDDDKIDTNEKNEPTFRFRSTQIDADVKLNNLENMPCMILVSVFSSWKDIDKSRLENATGIAKYFIAKSNQKTSRPAFTKGYVIPQNFLNGFK